MLGESIVLRSLEQFVEVLSNFAEELKGKLFTCLQLSPLIRNPLISNPLIRKFWF